MKLVRTKPPGRVYTDAQFHVITDKNTLHWFQRREHALFFMALDAGKVPDYEEIFAQYIIADPSGKIHRDGVVCFTGIVPPEISHTLHFQRHAPIKIKVPFIEIQALGKNAGHEIYGRPDYVEREFELARLFLELAAQSKSAKSTLYPMTTFADLVRIFGAIHCNEFPVAHVYSRHPLFAAAQYAGVEVRQPGEFPAGDYAEGAGNDIRRTGGIYLPLKLSGSVFYYPGQHVYQDLTKKHIQREPSPLKGRKKKASHLTKTLSQQDLNSVLMSLPRLDPASKLDFGVRSVYKRRYAELGLSDVTFDEFVKMIVAVHEKQAAKATETA